jgi:hypothetical protein
LRYLPVLLELLAFTAAYWLIPHRTIQLRFAFVGGLLATILFEWLKWGLAIYLRGANFQQLYGTLAVVPILLVWVYFSWLAVLFGASLAASLGSFRYQPRALRLSPGGEIYGVLRLLGRFDEARRDGQGLHLADIQKREPGLTDELLQTMISALCEMNIIQRGESGAWLLTRDLRAVTFDEVYEGMSLRVPDARAVPAAAPRRHRARGAARARGVALIRCARRCRAASPNCSKPRCPGRAPRTCPDAKFPAPRGRLCALLLVACRQPRTAPRTAPRRPARRPAATSPSAGRARDAPGHGQGIPRAGRARPSTAATGRWRSARQVGGGEFLGDLVQPLPEGDPGLDAFDKAREDVEVIGLAYEEIERPDMEPS